jgi:hypothetical protein
MVRSVRDLPPALYCTLARMTMSKLQRSSLVLLLLAAAPLAAAKRPAVPTVDALIHDAESAVESGSVDPQHHLAPLVERLAASQDEGEQDSLVSAIERLGRSDGRSPAAVKTYLRQAAPPALLALARNEKAEYDVRGSALLALRALNVDDAMLDEGIAIAKAASHPQVQFRGRLLENWKRNRPPAVELAAPATAEDAARERAALDFIRASGSPVSAYSLADAARNANAALVAALLDAGVPVDAPQVAGGTPLGEAAGSGCVADHGTLEARLATIDLLIARGAKADWRDNGGNTLLIGAVHCPLPVMERLIAAGASPSAAGETGFSPLQFALANGRWDLAELLVAHGARLSPKELDELFFEKPTEPGKLALLEKATSK